MSLDLSKIIHNVTINNTPVAIYNKNDNFSPFLQDIKKLSDPEKVFGAHITEYTFAECSNLEEVYLDNVGKLENYAFAGCKNLSKITMTSNAIILSSYAFKNCKIKEAYFPNAITLNLGGFAGNNGAFQGQPLEIISAPKVEKLTGDAGFQNTPLSNVYFPECKQIGEGMFRETLISEITLSNFTKLESIADIGFIRCSKLEKVITNASSFGSGIFLDCVNLKTVEMPNLASVYNTMFRWCISLEEVSFSNVTVIGSSAFSDCIGLKRVNCPNCVTISENAFMNCKSLEIVDFPLCETIGTAAFSNCRNISTINFPILKTVESYAFNNCRNINNINLPLCELVKSRGFYGCGTETIDLPECLTLNEYAFNSCILLKSANLPKCTYISIGAFSNCVNLSEINLPNCSLVGIGAFSSCLKLSQISLLNCTTIASSAFCSCRSLEKLVLPNCSSIGSNVFSGCSKLSALVLAYSEVISFAGNNSASIFAAFSGTPMRTSTYLGYYGSIYVPASLVSNYQTIWGKSMSSRITSIENWTEG